jgi:hypothetical protein
LEKEDGFDDDKSFTEEKVEKMLAELLGLDNISPKDLENLKRWFPKLNNENNLKQKAAQKPIPRKEIAFKVEPDGKLKISWSYDLLVP